MKFFYPCHQQSRTHKWRFFGHLPLSDIDLFNFFSIVMAALHPHIPTLPNIKASKTKPSETPGNWSQMQIPASSIFPCSTQNSGGCEVDWGSHIKLPFSFCCWMVYFSSLLPSLCSLQFCLQQLSMDISRHPSTLNLSNLTPETLSKGKKNKRLQSSICKQKLIEHTH